VPAKESLDVSGLGLSDEQLELLLSVDREVWKEEASLIPPDYEKFGDHLPQQLWDEHRALLERLEG
jgi:phosphoenolpyruvate carboxykinase (GTP)